jgi:LPS-assembly protein
VSFTAYGRYDVYNTHDVTATSIVPYRGDPGWTTRGIGAVAADMRWPFAGELFGGTQRITPRVQIVASPSTKNLDIPNEDARAVELEDSNLFALNRFSGYDRWEDGNRITYGGEYAFDLPRFSLRAVIGQSYRLTSKPSILPPGTGLSDRFSDIVGRTVLRYGQFLSLTHRYRLDKDNFHIRRNEVDATIGTAGTYVTLGYLRLNRNIPAIYEDLRDREEARVGARVQIARRWSVYGSTIIDLTSNHEDPLSTADGYEPVRHRLGVRYEDECLDFSVTWRKDYDPNGDASRGNAFMVRLAFKNLGR